MGSTPNRGIDPVRVFERHALEGLRAGARAPRLQLNVTLGFVAIAALVACAGKQPWPPLIGVLLWVALVRELPGALWARWSGRSVRVKLSVLGGETQIDGAVSSPGLALGFATLGSVVSLLLGVAIMLAAGRLSSWPAVVAMTAGRLHILWGAIHFLPLAPFKVGMLMAGRLGAAARVKHALASLLFALGLVVCAGSKLESPLVFVALLLLVWSCSRNLSESWAAAHDAALDVGARLQQLERMTSSGYSHRAIAAAQELRDLVRSPPLKAQVGRLLAWAAISDGNAKVASEALLELPPDAVDLYLLCSFMSISGRTPRAIALLEAAHTQSVRSSSTIKLLVDLYYREGRFEDVASLATTAAGLLTAADLAQIDAALAEARPAARERVSLAQPVAGAPVLVASTP